METRCKFSSFFRTSLVGSLAATLLLLLGPAALAEPSTNSALYSPTAKPFGKTYAQWTARWWKWALSLPVEGHPFTEPGFDCNVANNGQSGPVWFLALSSAPPEARRTCTIPGDTAVLIGIANSECSSLEPTFPDGTGGQTKGAQRDCANFFANHVVVSSLSCTIDGKAVTNLRAFRFVSPQFTFDAPTPWIFGDTGGSGTAVSDGYFVMLKPPAHGRHTVNCRGKFHFSVAEGDPFDADFGFGNTYHLYVRE